MASADTTALDVAHRDPSGSRAVRRLRRDGKVPGIVYGRGEAPVAFEVDARLLRQTLARARAVLDLSIDGATTTPVVVKELTRHPVTGATVHIDLLRVRLDQAIQAMVVVELINSDSAPGIKEGGVLEQITREVTIEALPTDIPESLQHDVSEIKIGDTVTLGQLTPPSGVALVDDPEIVIATVSPPRLQAEEEVEIEEEVERVAEAPTAGEAEEAESDDGEGESGE
jgi:large subunit ribosomal protein L25